MIFFVGKFQRKFGGATHHDLRILPDLTLGRFVAPPTVFIFGETKQAGQNADHEKWKSR